MFKYIIQSIAAKLSKYEDWKEAWVVTEDHVNQLQQQADDMFAAPFHSAVLRNSYLEDLEREMRDMRKKLDANYKKNLVSRETYFEINHSMHTITEKIFEHRKLVMARWDVQWKELCANIRN